MDVYQNLLNFAAVESRNVKMMDTVALNTFMLDVPIDEVNFFKQIVKKMGWHLHSKRSMTAYEQSLDDERNGRINHYANSGELFEKMGI